MPVEDRPVHPKTKRDESYRYGCWNRNNSPPGYMVRDGLVMETRRINGELVNVAYFKMKYVDDVFTQHCCYDFRGSDTACIGCERE